MLYVKVDCILIDESNLCSNEEMFISYDCIFGTNVEPQEMSMNDSCLTPHKCFAEVSSKDIITQERYADVPFDNSQATK